MTTIPINPALATLRTRAEGLGFRLDGPCYPFAVRTPVFRLYDPDSDLHVEDSQIEIARWLDATETAHQEVPTATRKHLLRMALDTNWTRQGPWRHVVLQIVEAEKATEKGAH